MPDNHKTNFFILAGTSGAGKTSVLNGLRGKGFSCVGEAARSVLTEQLAINGPGLPSNSPLRFIQMMMERSIEAFEASKLTQGISFFDRGMPDLIAYALRFAVDPTEVKQVSEKYLYNRTVFMFPPWNEIFVNDNERRMTFEQSVEFHQLVLNTYQELDYDLVEVPFETVEARVNFILKRIPT